MADKQTERAIRNLRERHIQAAVKAAVTVQEYAGYVLRDLRAGRSPHYSLVDDAVELARRIAALQAVNDAVGIYAAEEADRQAREDAARATEITARES